MEMYVGTADAPARFNRFADRSVAPFAVAGPRLRDNGLSVLPIRPDGKMPGKFVGAEWRLLPSWQRFCERLPTELEMGIWERWPAANVGLALGPASGDAHGIQLVALDLDTDDAEITEAILSAVPGSPVRKRGRKGQTLFYRAPMAVVSRAFNIGSERVLDLLCNGRQTVLPPSVHPTTGEPYVWTTLDTLESYPVAGLPMLRDDVAGDITQALEPFGVTVGGARSGSWGTPCLDNVSPHRALNLMALGNLDAWVPALRLQRCERQGAGFRAVPHWRPSNSGRPLRERSPNLSIRPDGIRDWGDTRGGLSPLDLVMLAADADLDMAFKWLSDRVDPQPDFSDFRGPR